MQKAFLEKTITAVLLLIIILFSFYIRSINTIPDKMLGYDPIFQYRFTKYLVDFGQLPVWDELSYYTGRAVSISTPPLMYYTTALIYYLTKNLGWSLITTATFAAALYGALISVPAFLLARELSNRWGGLLGATLTACAPQILVRTFGSSFDTDQLAIFFILLTLWAGIYALKKRSIFSITLAATCFVLFATAWQMFWYTFFFMVAAAGIYVTMNFLVAWKRKSSEDIKIIINETKKYTFVILSIFFLIIIATSILQLNPITNLFGIIGFAQQAEKLIVNISIAELQLIDITNIETWMLAAGRFVTGIPLLDNLFFISLFVFTLYGLKRTFRVDKISFAFLLAIILLSAYTLTRGIRFTEFSSGLLIAVAAAGFGHLVMETSRKDTFIKTFSIGLGIFLTTSAIFMALYVGQHLGPDLNQNWDNAWTYLRTQTPELSLVGTWWDPGHMITGLAERRVIADGAHCGYQCLYGINDRITSLGKIMATEDENVSLELINKYRGTSPKIYWIASDDLIGKYQWLQYFGTGCDARSDSRCPIYSVLGLQSLRSDQAGTLVVKIYGPVLVFNMANESTSILVQGRNAALLEETLHYDNDEVKSYKINNKSQTIEKLEPLVKQLGYRMSNQTIPYAVWVSKDSRMAVLIPPHLRNTVFTRMFFLEGQGLEHFKQVFRNEQVKIYEVEL